MQHTLIHQRGHRAVNGRHIGWLGIGRQGFADPLVDLRDRQMPVDRLEHGQHMDPRRHPPQPAGTQEVTDPLGDGGVEGRRPGRHPFSVAPRTRDGQCHRGGADSCKSLAFGGWRKLQSCLRSAQLRKVDMKVGHGHW